MLNRRESLLLRRGKGGVGRVDGASEGGVDKHALGEGLVSYDCTAT